MEDITLNKVPEWRFFFFLHNNWVFMTSKLISVLMDSITGAVRLSSYGYPVVSETFSSHEIHFPCCTELTSHDPERDNILARPWDMFFFQ